MKSKKPLEINFWISLTVLLMGIIIPKDFYQWVLQKNVPKKQKLKLNVVQKIKIFVKNNSMGSRQLMMTYLIQIMMKQIN